jgi:type I restriction enzyme R subunit
VLKGYVTYDLAFKLEQAGPDIDVKSGKARKKIFQYANLHPTSIGQKIAISAGRCSDEGPLYFMV